MSPTDGFNRRSLNGEEASSSMECTAQPLHGIIRRLVTSMHTIFRQAHSMDQVVSAVSGLGTVETELFSRLYRDVIKNTLCILNENDDYDENTKNKYGNILMSSQIIWSLLETITLRPSTNSPVIDLVEWNKENACTIPDERLARMMNDLTDNNGQVEQHPDYWTMVQQQVMFANFDTAVTLLKFHSKYKENDTNYYQIVSTLELMRLALARNKTSTEEFIKQQKNLESVRSLAPTKCPNLNYLYSILLGEPSVFVECSTKLDMKWYEILPAFLLFAYPKSRTNDLGQLAEKLFRQIQKSDSACLLDKIFLSIFSMNFLGAIQMICSTGPDSWWLSVHLIDLITMHDPSVFAASRIKSESTDLALHTRVLLSYADILFENGLWELSIDYYLNSGVESSLDKVDQRLKEVDWNGDVYVVERIVATCQNYGFGRAKTHFTRTMAMKYMDEKYWSAALCWAMRNTNVDLISQVAEKILQEGNADDIAKMHMFNKMTDTFFVTPELKVIFSFYKYRQAINEGDFVRALSLLYDLFLNNSAPERFFVTVLREITRLLHAFNADDMTLQTLNGISVTNDISEICSTFDTNLVQGLIKAVTKFEFFYDAHYAHKRNAESINCYEDIHKELRKLKPQLNSLLSHSFITASLL